MPKLKIGKKIKEFAYNAKGKAAFKKAKKKGYDFAKAEKKLGVRY